jgi:hypothetical protein
MQMLRLEMGNRKVEILGAELEWWMRLTTDGVERGKKRKKVEGLPLFYIDVWC